MQVKTASEDQMNRLTGAASVYMDVIKAVAAEIYGPDGMADWEEQQKASCHIQSAVTGVVNVEPDIDLRARFHGVGVSIGNALAQFTIGQQSLLMAALGEGVNDGIRMATAAEPLLGPTAGQG
jgi:hypothetical protein